MTAVLIGISLSAAAIILTATVTPGWFRVDIHLNSKKLTGDMNVFYSRVCEESKDTCFLFTFLDSGLNSKLSSLEGRFKRYFVEGIFTILCTTIGCFLTVVYKLRKRKQDNVQDLRPKTSTFTNAGLSFSIIGGVCGFILAIDFILFNDLFEDNEETLNMSVEKRFPYSLVIISAGLLLHAISIIRHINLRKAPNIGIILQAAFSGPTCNIEEHEPIV